MTDFDLTALLPPPFPSQTPTKTTAPTPQQTQMAVLKDALSQSLMPNDNGREMLKRQMATLDTLFAHLVADYAAQKNQSIGYSQNERLDFLLKLQNGCTRTARALSAMDYMDSLTGAPPSPKNDEQKEDGA